jgi:hypothetical protein
LPLNAKAKVFPDVSFQQHFRSGGEGSANVRNVTDRAHILVLKMHIAVTPLFGSAWLGSSFWLIPPGVNRKSRPPAKFGHRACVAALQKMKRLNVIPSRAGRTT